MATVLVGGLAVAGLALLAGIGIVVKRRLSRRSLPRRPETSHALDSCVERLEQIAVRFENILVNLKELEQATREGLEDLQVLRSGLPLATTGSAEHRAAIRTRGSARGAESPPEDLDPADDVVQSLMSQLDRQPMTLAQVRDCAAQYGRQVAILAPANSNDWLLIALSAGSGNRWFILPRLHIAMGQVRLIDYFELRNYNGVDPLRARDITTFGQVEKTSAGWKVVSRGWIDVQGI